jgi:predicted Zn-dependent protease with MMP-like domain
VVPDIITLYRGCIAEVCDTSEEIGREVQQTVKHEIAHYFGMDEEEIEDLGY